MSTNTNEPELELYIIRHGQTYGNLGLERNNVSAEDLYDSLLTEKGMHQAELLGKRFRQYPFDAVYASGLRRTLMTASEIINYQPENGAKEIKILPLLTECNMSHDYAGYDFASLKKSFPCAVLADGVKETDSMVCHTSGWDDKQQEERAKKIIGYLRDRYKNGEKVAVTAHAAFNTFLVHASLGLDPTKVIFDPHFLNTGVTKIVFFKPGTGRYGIDIQLVYLNDLSHLYADYPEYGLEQCYF